MDLKFKKWVENNKNSLLKQNIVVEEVVNAGRKSNNPSTRADFISDRYLGRVTVWKSGSIDLEILDIEKISSVFFDSTEVDSNTDFNVFLKDFFAKLIK